MKKILYLLPAAVIFLLASCSTSRNYAQSYRQPGYGDEVTYQQFYDDLSPYGDWMMYPGYGYVWSPYEAGFHPYQTNGRWAFTDMGWMWVSNYRWGWAPFHYGRWMRDMRYGWLWVPGYEWAPAWVAWRGGGGYYGWAPLGPGMSINISLGSIPNNNWYFVPSRYINSNRMNHYYVRPSSNVTIINNTTIINNYNNGQRQGRYNQGPRIMDVERHTNQQIAPVRVVNRSTPGSQQVGRNEIAIYKPTVRETSNSVQPRNTKNAPVRNFNTPAPVTGNDFQNHNSDQPVREMQKRENYLKNVNRQRVFERTNPDPRPNPTPQQNPVERKYQPVEPPVTQPSPKEQPVRRFTPADDPRVPRQEKVERQLKEQPSPTERRMFRQNQPRQIPEVKRQEPARQTPRFEKPNIQQRQAQDPTKMDRRRF